MCNFCGYDHGIIGDVVCPIMQRFPIAYSSKHIPALEATWDVAKYDFTKPSSYLHDTEGFLKVLAEVNRSSVYINNATCSGSPYYKSERYKSAQLHKENGALIQKGIEGIFRSSIDPFKN